MKEINLIWQTNIGDNTTFEMEYTLELLFKNFRCNKIFDYGSFETVLDNSVILISYPDNPIIYERLNDYIDKFNKESYNVYLLEYSNESYGKQNKHYNKLNRVFRPYYDSEINHPNVTFIPIGFKSGFYSEVIKTNNKEYNFSFIGQPKSDRYEVINQLQEMNGFVHTTNQWNCPTSLSIDECKDIYSKSRFVPCPMGNTHPDSFRIMEVLESGSIPVLKTYNNLDYFKNVWGESPLPIVNNWVELNQLNNLTDDEYDTLYFKVKDWYLNFRDILSNNIESFIL